MMYDLDRKLLDLNRQILSYKLAINQGIDPGLANSFLNANAYNDQNTQLQQTNNVIPIEPSIIEEVSTPVTLSEDIHTEDSSSIEDVVTVEKTIESTIIRGPRGKRGKRGPKGDRGEAGKDASFVPILVEHNYSAPKECNFLLVNSSESITISLPDDVPDGKIIVIKVMPNSALKESREITLKSEGAGMIEGEFSFILKGINECVIMFSFKGDWFILNHYPST